MDHTRILNEIRSQKTLELGFDYALYDRLRRDFYFDYFEIEYANANKQAVLDEIAEELREPEGFVPRLGYAYFPPKTALCYRRMIYLPFKDLVIRYAFCTVFAKYLERGMLPSSFANRRATGDQARFSLLQDFSATSWPNFCTWQREQAKLRSVLLRTDISSFYDSISHSYLLDAISQELSLSPESPVMKLFRRLLTVTVISYSRETGRIKQNELLQGLPIGNGTEGFFANIYLNKVDSSMKKLASSNGIGFGRYNDDMRIFGDDRQSVLDAVRLLQDALLVKGLNLNANKTEIAANQKDMADLRSKDYELSDYQWEEDEVEDDEPDTTSETISVVQSRIDLHFHEFNTVFVPGQLLVKDKEGKDFCKFLSVKKADGSALLHISERLPEHINMLYEVATKWQGSGKHAAWLMVQSAFYGGVRPATASKAKEVLFLLLENGGVNSYIKYRLLHHLVRLRKRRKGIEFRYLDLLSADEKKRLREFIPRFIAQPAFELNVVSLYVCYRLGASRTELEELVRVNAINPDADPLRNALSFLDSPQIETRVPATSLAQEPDDIQAEY